ncbi:hypothetical protein Unana1_02525 [Umbelopsis nana]
MISTITEFSRGSMNMIFTGDMNEYEFPDLYNSRKTWPVYSIMKVPHHCSKFSIDNLFSTIVANVYLISGQSSGNILQPAGTCLQELILQRRIKNPNIGTAHIFVTNWESSAKNDLSSILTSTVAPTNSYRIYVLNGGVTDGQFRVSDSGDVVIITNQWTDMTPGSQPRFDKVLTNPFPQADPSYTIG